MVKELTEFLSESVGNGFKKYFKKKKNYHKKVSITMELADEKWEATSACKLVPICNKRIRQFKIR